MNSLNSILIEGNLSRDPNGIETPKGTVGCNFTIETRRVYKSGDEVTEEKSYFTIEVWGKLAESCLAYLSEGRGVRVVGRIKQDRWMDGNGNPRSQVKIIGEHVEFKHGYKK